MDADLDTLCIAVYWALLRVTWVAERDLGGRTPLCT